MTAVPLVFDSTVTAAYAAVTGNVAGAPPVDGVIGQKKVWAFRFDTTCPSDVTDIAVNVDLTTWVLAGGMGAGDSDGISIQLLDLGINAQVPWTATVGGDLYFAPGNNGTVRVGYLGQGGTTSGPGVVTVSASGLSGLIGPLALGLIVDLEDSVGQPGNAIGIATPTVADVTFTVGSPCAVAVTDPIPVDNVASSTVGTPAVVDVSVNDDNTPCDPLPGCAVYSTSVVVEPGSTAGGITASVDSAGVATVNAAKKGAN